MKRFIILILLSLIVSVRADVVTLVEPSQEMPDGKTVVWSPLFQATWDKMNETIGGKPKKIEPPNVLMTKLDTFVWEPKKIMPEGGWKTWSGPANKEFLESVNRDAVKLTGEEKGPFKLDDYPLGSAVACFGLLNREVEFEEAFYKSMKVPVNFGEKKSAVRFFGTKGEKAGEYGKSVKVLAYRPKDGSHALEISCKEMDDKVIVYMPPKAQNFDTACLWIREWRKVFTADEKTKDDWNDRYLHAEDEVVIPYVSLKTEADLKSQLEGNRHYESGPPWYILAAIQNTEFDLHEKGARVRVEATLVAAFLGAPNQSPTPRKFIYDRPFFVFLWRENAEWPYLGVWVGDDSVLKKFN